MPVDPKLILADSCDIVGWAFTNPLKKPGCGSVTDFYSEESSCEYSHLSSTAAYPVQPMLLLSAGCGWHCVWLPVAHQCCSRCWAPRCSGARAVSPAAAPQPGTSPPLWCPPHTVEKTSYFKCWRKKMVGFFQKKTYCVFERYENTTLSPHEVKGFFCPAVWSVWWTWTSLNEVPLCCCDLMSKYYSNKFTV